LSSLRSRRLLALVALLPLLAGCPKPGAGPDATAPSPTPADRSAGAFAQTDPWLLTTADPAAARGNHGVFLGNGYLGATFGPNGGAGKDAVAYVAGLYDDKENLKPVPNWHDLGLPDPKPGEKYEQTLDLKRGVLTTKAGGVTVTAFVSASHPDTAVLHVEGAPKPAAPPAFPPDPKVSVTVQDTAESDGSWTRVVRAHKATESFDSNKKPRPGNYLAWLGRHTAEWAARWNGADIAIEGDPEAQQLVHKLLFDLMQSARPSGADSVPPETLSGDFYKGHVFWDAEIWIFPALLAQHPDLARTVLDYRFARLDAARKLAKQRGYAGADFPWESAATGNEVGPAQFTNERHVTAAVGWAAWQYYLATQDKKWLAERGWPVLSAVADYWASRAKKDPADGKYHVKGVTGPDESRTGVDDNTYTNAMARYVLRAAGAAAKVVGKPANPKWADVAENIALPFDKAKGAYLARANDGGEKTKQADGELTIYPAKLAMDKATAEKTFDYNAARPITNGPAMTDSIHALIAARLGRAEQAEKDFRDAYRPFMRGPFLLFSEKRSLDRCVFATGAGGTLQAVLYGFGGLDFDDWDGAAKRPVALPPSWKSLKISGIRRAGKVYTLTVTPAGRTLTEQR
jgi:trehalose/maltose hydrolase-like predicted phosphorylase